MDFFTFLTAARYELLRKIAFGVLYGFYGGAGAERRIEDFLHELVVTLERRWGSVDPARPWEPLVREAARNLLIDQYRREKDRPAVHSIDEQVEKNGDFSVRDGADEPWEIAAAREEARLRLARVLEVLAKEELMRRVAILSRHPGLREWSGEEEAFFLARSGRAWKTVGSPEPAVEEVAGWLKVSAERVAKWLQRFRERCAAGGCQEVAAGA
jgi:DNA-directed RNA polymerase specialized sigma24 family protein